MTAFMDRDITYDGIFFTGVRTTGIFCRPTCTAKKPKPENVEFFPTARDALFSGYRPCKRCHPLEAVGSPPNWLAELLNEIDSNPSYRWRDSDLRNMGLHPDRVRRWFKQHHNMTFHAYARARRLGMALTEIRQGSSIAPAAFNSGYESLSGFNEAFRQLLGTSPCAAQGAPLVVVQQIPTLLGPIIAGATENKLCFLEFADRRMLEKQLKTLHTRLGCTIVPGTNPIIKKTHKELKAYFQGKLQRFTVPLLTPGSAFQQRVWKALQEIPYGTTTSYGELARKLGLPAGHRAVARANGDNRIAIIIPCHRVINSDGKLAGYGGGVWRKQRLIDIERSQL